MKKLSREMVKRELIKKLAAGETKISLIIKDLELGPTISQRRTYSVDSMLKSYVFMQLKGIKSNRKLVMRLLNDIDDRRNLGFDDKIPSHQDFSAFMCKLETNYKLLAKYVVDEVNELSGKYEIELDRQYKHIAQETEVNGLTRYQINSKKKELLRELFREFMPKLKMKIKKNAIYSKKEHMNVIFKAALEQGFTHGAAESLINKVGEGNSPASNTVLWNLDKLTVKEIQNAFTEVCSDTLQKAKRRRMFVGKTFDVAVDYTLLHYYGNRSHPDIINRYDDRGTNKYFGFITIVIVEKGFRFTAYAIPVFDDIRKIEQCELVEMLVNEIRKYVNIQYLYADRGFGYADTFRTLEKLGVKYSIPIADTSRLKNILSYVTFPMIIKDHVRGGYTIPYLCLVKTNKGIIKLATNIELKTKDVSMLLRLPDLYGKRWGIETSYRVKKRCGLAKTTSNNYKIRLFYFLLSVIIYNLWILLNILMALEFGTRKDKKYYVIFKSALETLLDIT